MGFDQNSNQPVVQMQKRTTKVNVGIIVGVIVFLVVGAAAVMWFWLHPPQTYP
jgi:hypothetical protein